MNEERIQRTPITVHIPEDVLLRAIEAMRSDPRSVYERMSPDTRKLIDQNERAQRIGQDYNIRITI